MNSSIQLHVIIDRCASMSFNFGGAGFGGATRMMTMMKMMMTMMIVMIIMIMQMMICSIIN